MSKIGDKPIVILDGVSVVKKDDQIQIKGPFGETSLNVPKGIEIRVEKQQLLVERKGSTKRERALHGLTRMLLANAVKGVVEPWEKVLEIHGTGYKAAKEGENLVLKLGFSHPVHFSIPKDIAVEIKGNKIHIKGIDKQRVGEVAAKIRKIRQPDKYKGKGIRYMGEILRLKPGKKAKTTA